MASSNYMLCDECGRKTVYIGEDDHPGFPIFCDDKCVIAYASRLVAAPSSVPANAQPTPMAALYGFAAWLTCRERPVTFGANHEAASAAELVNEFCKSQGFDDLPDGWVDTLKPYPPANAQPTSNDDADDVGDDGVHFSVRCDCGHERGDHWIDRVRGGVSCAQWRCKCRNFSVASLGERPTFGALSFAIGFAARVFGENITDPKAQQSLAWIQNNLRALLDASEECVALRAEVSRLRDSQIDPDDIFGGLFPHRPTCYNPVVTTRPDDGCGCSAHSCEDIMAEWKALRSALEEAQRALEQAKLMESALEERMLAGRK